MILCTGEERSLMGNESHLRHTSSSVTGYSCSSVIPRQNAKRHPPFPWENTWHFTQTLPLDHPGNRISCCSTNFDAELTDPLGNPFRLPFMWRCKEVLVINIMPLVMKLPSAVFTFIITLALFSSSEEDMPLT